MELIIWYVEVQSLLNSSYWIFDIRDVHQYCYLCWPPMHGLYLILHFKAVILCKINNRNHNVAGKLKQAVFKLLGLPPKHKVMLDKAFQMIWKKKNKSCTFHPFHGQVLSLLLFSFGINLSNTHILKYLNNHLLAICCNLVWAEWQLPYTASRALSKQASPCMIFMILRARAQHGIQQVTYVLKNCLVCRTLTCITMSTTNGACTWMFFCVMPKLVLAHLIESILEVYHLDMVNTAASIALFQLSDKEWLECLKGPKWQLHRRIRALESFVELHL